MNYEVSELRKIQIIELEILKAIKNCCDEHNIDYFLVGGTALGAKRHKAFIPWDDDIDIGMLRKDYERFLEIAPGILGDEYFVQTPDSDPYSSFSYCKVKKNNTEFIEYCNRNSKMHQGIFVDIFPYDNVSPNINIQRKQFKRMKRLVKINVLRQTEDISVPPIDIKTKYKFWLRRIVHRLMRIIPRKILVDLIRKEATRYNNVDTKQFAALNVAKLLVCSEEMLFPLKELKFEDDYFKAPNQIEKYLTEFFGNYMELPPENERIGHKPYTIKI